MRQQRQLASTWASGDKFHLPLTTWPEPSALLTKTQACVQEHQSNFSIARRIIGVNGIEAHAIPTLRACSTCHHELLTFAAILVGMALKTSCPFTKGVTTVVQMAFSRCARYVITSGDLE